MHCTIRRVGALALLATIGVAGSLQAQDTTAGLQPRGPRFLLASAGSTKAPARLDVSRTPVLRQRISLHLDGATVGEALTAIKRLSGLQLVYSSTTVPLDRPVRLKADEITVAGALSEVLLDTDVDVLFSKAGKAVLVRRTEPAQAVQTGTIMGRVTDAGTGLAILAADVRVLGAEIMVATDDSGRYVLRDVPAGAQQVTARRIGYRAQTLAVTVLDGQTTTLHFELAPQATQLQELVTTVTGEQQLLELGHVVGRINADSLVRETPITRLADAIGARVPGVQLISTSGFAGESPRLRIRGLSSATLSRDPLLVVDGVRVDNSTSQLFHPVAGFLTYGHMSGRFNDINPEEIESIEIVKGPSAATLYGTDGANGVIVIKTKRGAPGRPRWTLYAEGGLSSPGVDAPLSYHSWGRDVTTGAVQQCTLRQQADGSCVADSLTTFSPLRDPATTFVGTGLRSQLGAQVSGGAEQIRYFFSGEHESEQGYLEMPAAEQARIGAERSGAAIPEEQIHPNALRRVSLRGKVDAALGQRTDLTLSTGFVRTNSRIPRGNEWSAAYWGPGYRDAMDGWNASVGRPGETFALRSAENATHFTSSLNGNWRALDWLTARGTVGVDFSSMFFDGLQRRGEGVTSGRNGRRLNLRDDVTLVTGDLGASAAAAVGANLSSRTSLGVQYNRRFEYVTTSTGTDLPPGSGTIAGAAAVTSQERTVESVVAGAYVEQTFGLKERVFVTGALRADGASTFGRNFSTAIYPKASFSWLLSDESFFPRLPGSGSLRLRAAYGASGVQPGVNDALALLTPFTTFVDGAATSGAILGAIGNPDLKPERTREFEGGLDAELFEGRVKLEATYYNKLSTDALINRPLPTSVGIVQRRENIGSVRNWGWEGLLTVVPIDGPALQWDLTLNGSINHNRLVRVNGDVTFGTSSSTLREGYPLFGRWDYPILGYGDADGDGIIEPTEVQLGAEEVYLGATHPPRQLTMATGVSLFRRRLRVSSQFDYRGGHLGMNFTELNRCSSYSVCRAANDPTAPHWDQARATAAAAVQPTTWAGYMEDASFVRWREFAVSLQVPERFAARLGAGSMTVTLAARNLALWSKYTSPDPEVNSSAGSLAPGDGAASEGNSDNPIAPQTRYWTLRVTIGS